MYPDYISAKKMKETYEGNVFSCMGCVDGKESVRWREKCSDKVNESFIQDMWLQLIIHNHVLEQEPHLHISISTWRISKFMIL